MIFRRSFLFTSVFLTLLLTLVSAEARGQWQLMGRVSASPDFGAMCFKDGIAWAASSDVRFSTDSGRTWLPSNFSGLPSEPVYDIAFANQDTGALVSGAGLFLTTDR